MFVYSDGGFADDGAAMMFLKAAALARPDVAAEYAGTLDGPLEDGCVLVKFLRRVPSTIEQGTVMAAMMKRGSRRYVSIPCPLEELPEGSRVVTCVPAAMFALREEFPSLYTDPADDAEQCFAMLDEGKADAIVLPEMEVILSGMWVSNRVPDSIPQAASQGVVVAICRSDDDDTLTWARSVNHPPTRIEVGVERGVLKMMGAGPFTPVGVRGELEDMFVHVTASSYICPDGRRDVDDYVAIDYVMDDLLDIADYLVGKR